MTREAAPSGRSLLTAHFGRKPSESIDGAEGDKAKSNLALKDNLPESNKSEQPSVSEQQAQQTKPERDEKKEENAEAHPTCKKRTD